MSNKQLRVLLWSGSPVRMEVVRRIGPNASGLMINTYSITHPKTGGVFAYSITYQNEESGTLHREGGPARVLYNSSWRVVQQNWYRNGELHREDGPAVMNFCDGRHIPKKDRWYLNGNWVGSRIWKWPGCYMKVRPARWERAKKEFLLHEVHGS
jgi:hypothetical protein